jgi:hypothetical protein
LIQIASGRMFFFSRSPKIALWITGSFTAACTALGVDSRNGSDSTPIFGDSGE